MSTSGFGQGPKKETVYSGPAPSPRQGTVYGGPSIQTAGGTVYNGPSPGGTVYNGPTTGAVASRPMAGTATTSTNVAAAKGARLFYVIAGFTGINTVLAFVGIRFAIGVGAVNGTTLSAFLITNLLAAGLFVLLGIFTQGGSKMAFLAGMLLYGADLVWLAINNPALHIISIVIHGLFLYYLFSAYRQLPE
jgi:hypothetical protein